MLVVKVWLCVSGADHYLKSHPGLYQQLLSGPREEHLVDLINTGEHLVNLINTGEHFVDLIDTSEHLV